MRLLRGQIANSLSENHPFNYTHRRSQAKTFRLEARHDQRTELALNRHFSLCRGERGKMEEEWHHVLIQRELAEEDNIVFK